MSGGYPNARAERFAKAVLVALGASVLFVTAAGAGLDAAGGGPRLGGDYPAFHAAGSIVMAGDVDELWDPVRQQAEQEGLGLDGYLAFAYPPQVAVAYVPFAALGYRLGYLMHTVVMAAAVYGALRLLRSHVATLDRHFWVATALTFTFFPLFTAIGGGQNTAVTLVLLAVVWAALAQDRDELAGVAAGLLLFRPQYGLVLLGLLAVGRYWRAVGVGVATGLVGWLAAVPFLGVDWVSTWTGQALVFAEEDAVVNAANSISILGFLQALFGDGTSIRLVAFALVVPVVAFAVRMWATSGATIGARMAVTTPVLLLVSPHTMFYEAGLLVLTVAGLFAADVSPQRVVIFGGLAGWAFAFSQNLASGLGASPLVLLTVVAFGVAARAVARTADGDVAAGKELIHA